MKDEFCDYEVSLDLKELGFDCYYFMEYDGTGILQQRGLLESHGLPFIKAPLWQQAIDFFLNKFGIWIEISTSPIRFYDSDEKLMPPKYQFVLENIRDQNEYYILHSADDGLFYDNHKESRRAAILKAIEVCKKK